LKDGVSYIPILCFLKILCLDSASGPSTTPNTQYYPSQQWTPGPGSYYGPPPSNQPPQRFQYAGQTSPTSPAPLQPSNSPPPPPTNQTLISTTISTPKTQTSTALPSPAAPIDGGKLGLLPKRPVSLIRDENPTVAGKNTTADDSSSTTTPGTTAKGYAVEDDDDHGLEYVENPFDEPAHKK